MHRLMAGSYSLCVEFKLLAAQPVPVWVAAVDAKAHAIPLGPDVDRDATAGRAVGDRVVDEDRHELAEPERVAEHAPCPMMIVR